MLSVPSVCFARKVIRPLSKSQTFRKFARSLSSAETRKNGLLISEEVQEALHSGKGVVALESTIITHGMPYPHNFSTALSVERKIRESGSVPATVAVLDGCLRVGLSDTELILLAEKCSSLVKISRRDLSYVLSQGLSGGTTVSATMMACHMAGIPVFATGGIGGVHRGAETNFDISADLTELGRTPVAVVSSGVKSILDIGKTLEYLETQGVFVSTFGESKNFPAFFTSDSGHSSPYNVSSALEAAQIIARHLDMGVTSGLLFAVPIPEECGLPREDIDNVIEEALEMARNQGISGKGVTPFILEQVNKMTSGSSLQANIILIENNATAAGTMAHCLSLIRRGVTTKDILTDPFVLSTAERTSTLLQSSSSSSLLSSASASSPSSSSSSSSYSGEEEDKNQSLGRKTSHRPVVIGASIIDFLVQVNDENFQMRGATYPGKVSQSFGGVGRNLADCLSRLGMEPAFVSVVGDDALSDSLFTGCKHMDMTHVRRLPNSWTATYCPIQGAKGRLLFGVGDMDINGQFDHSKVTELDSVLSKASMLLLDGNFSHHAIGHVVNKCCDLGVPVWFEPTDVHKAAKPFLTDAWQSVTFTSPNLEELKVMHKALMEKLGQPVKDTEDDLDCDNAELSQVVNLAVSLCRDLVAFMPAVLVTLGRHGAVLCHRYGDVSHLSLDKLRRHIKEERKSPVQASRSHQSEDSFRAWLYPALGEGMEEPDIASVSGAGDCLTAAFVAGLHRDLSLDSCIRMGLLAASISLVAHRAIPEAISPSSVTEETAAGWATMKCVDVTKGMD